MCAQFWLQNSELQTGLIFGPGFGTETEVLVFSKNWNWDPSFQRMRSKNFGKKV